MRPALKKNPAPARLAPAGAHVHGSRLQLRALAEPLELHAGKAGPTQPASLRLTRRSCRAR